MRRALLLCLAAVATAAPAHTQQQQQSSDQWQAPRPHHLEKDWNRKEPQSVPPAYYCKSTKPSYPNGYPSLNKVNRTDGLAEYSGSLITWTPNDNPTECHIRQLYFWVSTVYTTAPDGAREDVRMHMTRHGKIDLVVQPLVWDVISIQYPGATLYEIDAQQEATPPDANGLQGDFDFAIDIIGTPQ